MTKLIAQTYEYTNEFRSTITYGLFALSVLMVLVYIFNIYNVVARSVAVGQAEAKVAALEANVQELDTTYIKLSNKITPESLKVHGMSEGTVTSYISRTTSLGVVSLGGHEL